MQTSPSKDSFRDVTLGNDRPLSGSDGCSLNDSNATALLGEFGGSQTSFEAQSIVVVEVISRFRLGSIASDRPLRMRLIARWSQQAKS